MQFDSDTKVRLQVNGRFVRVLAVTDGNDRWLSKNGRWLFYWARAGRYFLVDFRPECESRVSAITPTEAASWVRRRRAG